VIAVIWVSKSIKREFRTFESKKHISNSHNLQQINHIQRI